MRETAQVVPCELGFRCAVPDLEHHRQDLALVLFHQLSRRVEPHHHQGDKHQPLQVLQDPRGLCHGQGFLVLLDAQGLGLGVPFQVWDVVVLVQDQHFGWSPWLGRLPGGRAGGRSHA